MIPEGLHALIDGAGSRTPNFPPTLVFNEGWMLRLILSWFASHAVPGHSLAFQPDATWFSEALLPSPFLRRYRSDNRAEAHTHADGVIGHVSVGASAKADTSLLPNAFQLVVTEAKMFSPLSAGTRNAPGYDQAARSVACIAEMLSRAGRHPSQLQSLGFFVLAPEAQIRDAGLSAKLEKDSITQAVRSRAAPYGTELDSWLSDWFLPTLAQVQIGPLSWEQMIADISPHDPQASQSLLGFYRQCLTYNAPGIREVHA